MKDKKNKKLKKRIVNIIYTIIIIVLVLALGFSIYKIINWDKDNKRVKELVSK